MRGVAGGGGSGIPRGLSGVAGGGGRGDDTTVAATDAAAVVVVVVPLPLPAAYSCTFASAAAAASRLNPRADRMAASGTDFRREPSGDVALSSKAPRGPAAPTRFTTRVRLVPSGVCTTRASTAEALRTAADADRVPLTPVFALSPLPVLMALPGPGSAPVGPGAAPPARTPSAANRARR